MEKEKEEEEEEIVLALYGMQTSLGWFDACPFVEQRY